MIQDPEKLRIFLLIYTFVLGTVFGSFLNVCIVRLPERKSLVRPASRCPICETPIRWYDNIPIVSFLLLRRKCRSCGTLISWQYPAVELLTGIMFVLLMREFTNFAALAIYIAFICSLIVITFVDLRHYIIPDEISIPGVFIGLALSLVPAGVSGGQLMVTSFTDSLIGCFVGGASLFLLAIFSLVVFKKEGMGGGDIKLLAMIGAFLGWKLTLMTIFVGSILGAAVSIVLVIMRLKGRGGYIPFGPYLAIGGAPSLLCGDRLIVWFFAFSDGLNSIVYGI